MDHQVKHTVVIVTYNQEHLIKIAIDSVLNQSILPYEIIIGDDCSSDATFDVLIGYNLLFPNLFKIFRQNENVGVFQNQNFLMEKVTGDVVSFLAGDDVMERGLFEELNSMIVNNQVEINGKFVLVTNSLSIDKVGNMKLINNFERRAINAFNLRLRYSIDYRSIGISAKLLREAGPLPLQFGYYGDWIWALKIDYFANKHYYSPFVSAIYYTGIGVASSTKKEVMSKSRLLVIEEIKCLFSKNLTKNDIKYLTLFEKFEKYQIMASNFNFLLLIKCYFENFLVAENRPFLFNYKNILPKQVLNFAQKIKTQYALLSKL